MISVLITTYNHEKWISQCIESVLNQSGGIREIIIHDDNSSDGTSDILESYRDRIKIIKNASGANIGISRSINRLLDSSSGEFIAFMSGDDSWRPAKLKTQLNYMLEHPEVDVCFTDSETIDAEGKLGPRFPAFDPNNRSRLDWLRRLISGNCLPAPSALMRKSTVIQEVRFNVALRQAQDWEYWIRLLCAGLNFYILPEPLLLYRVHPESASNKRSVSDFSRGVFETKEILKAYSNITLSDLRLAFGGEIEGSQLFMQYRSPEVGLAVLFSRVNSKIHKLAAAELFYKFYLDNKSLDDKSYHDFIGRLELGN